MHLTSLVVDHTCQGRLVPNLPIGSDSIIEKLVPSSLFRKFKFEKCLEHLK
jgi:hypothetical protein